MMRLLECLLSPGRLPLPAFLMLAPILGAASLIPIGWHVWWCVEKAAQDWQPVALLVAGLAIPPLGWAHGMSLLLGFGGWL